jgi:hypothetical protein
MGLTKDEERQILLLLEMNNKKLIEELNVTFVRKDLAMKCIIIVLIGGMIGSKTGILSAIMNLIV